MEWPKENDVHSSEYLPLCLRKTLQHCESVELNWNHYGYFELRMSSLSHLLALLLVLPIFNRLELFNSEPHRHMN